jgi:hypothetical protein
VSVSGSARSGRPGCPEGSGIPIDMAASGATF